MSAGLVLAAGAGTRFGGTKQLAEFRGRPLLEHAVEAMLAVPALDPVLVVLGHAAADIRAAVDFGGAEVVVCEDWADGQSASLRRGVAAARDAEAVVVTLGDQPFITPQVIAGALDHRDGYDALRTTFGGEPGHPVVLGRPVMDAVAGLTGDMGARHLLARFRVRSWEAGHLCSAADIDTREELSRLRAVGADRADLRPRPVSDDSGVCAGDVPPVVGSVLTGTGLTLAQAAARLERGEPLPSLTDVQRRIVEQYATSR